MPDQQQTSVPNEQQTSAAPSVPGGFTDERMEILMGRVLQVGVLLASFVVLLGGVLYVVRYHAEQPDYHLFHPGIDKVSLLAPGPLAAGIAHAQSGAIIQLGILLLIATPIARVICAVIAFALERDGLYVAVSVLVLTVLLWGMLRGG